jgi:hypothetical protein
MIHLETTGYDESPHGMMIYSETYTTQRNTAYTQSRLTQTHTHTHAHTHTQPAQQLTWQV